MDIKKYNRDQKTKPKQGKFWCGCGCDRYLVTVGQKCPACSSKGISKKTKT